MTHSPDVCHTTEVDSSTGSIPCPICGPRPRTHFGICRDRPIVRCDVCGLLFVSDRRSHTAIADYFRDDYVSNDEFARRKLVDSRRVSLERTADRVCRLQPGGGRLLDVGAATGTFLQSFTDRPGWSVEGIEPSPAAVRFARKQFGLTVHEGLLGEVGLPADTFDVITSLDSFICHPNPNGDLREFRRLLRPDGLLVFEIPGYTYRMLKDTGPVCRAVYGTSLHLKAGINLFYYSRRTLTRLLVRHRFEPVAAYPESMPHSGRLITQALKDAYFHTSSLVYHVTAGRLSVVPKELLVFRKQPEP